MATSDEISEAAEDAARDWLNELRPDITDWRPTTPENLGMGRDSWIDASSDIIERYNSSPGVPPVEMSDAERSQFYAETLLDFSTAIADRAEGVA